jgi:hypothetical protein
MPKDMKDEELFKRVLNVSLGRCPTPHTFLVLIQENEAKENQG